MLAITKSNQSKNSVNIERNARIRPRVIEIKTLRVMDKINLSIGSCLSNRILLKKKPGMNNKNANPVSKWIISIIIVYIGSY
jgi:hypothetical protein